MFNILLYNSVYCGYNDFLEVINEYLLSSSNEFYNFDYNRTDLGFE